MSIEQGKVSQAMMWHNFFPGDQQKMDSFMWLQHPGPPQKTRGGTQHRQIMFSSLQVIFPEWDMFPSPSVPMIWICDVVDGSDMSWMDAKIRWVERFRCNTSARMSEA